MSARQLSRTIRRPLILALAALMLLQSATPAWAWGRTGHRVIAKLAERHLTPAAKAVIAELLEPGESLADCSTWADEHRRELPKTAPWHYVDCPLDATRYDDKYAGDDPAKGFIVPKIREFRRIIGDRARPIEERRFALRFLVHLVEDLHMPLHVGENHDKGGNTLQVRWFDQGSNLHRVWDSGIIDHAGRGEDGWLADLVAMDTTEARGNARIGSVEEWATESIMAARQAYHDPTTSQRIKPGAKLGDDYQEQNLPLVKRRTDSSSDSGRVVIMVGWRTPTEPMPDRSLPEPSYRGVSPWRAGANTNPRPTATAHPRPARPDAGSSDPRTGWCAPRETGRPESHPCRSSPAAGSGRSRGRPRSCPRRRCLRPAG